MFQSSEPLSTTVLLTPNKNRSLFVLTASFSKRERTDNCPHFPVQIDLPVPCTLTSAPQCCFSCTLHMYGHVSSAPFGGNEQTLCFVASFHKWLQQNNVLSGSQSQSRGCSTSVQKTSLHASCLENVATAERWSVGLSPLIILVCGMSLHRE